MIGSFEAPLVRGFAVTLLGVEKGGGGGPEAEAADGEVVAEAVEEREGQRHAAVLADRDNYTNDAPAFKLYHWVNTAESATETRRMRLAPAPPKTESSALLAK